jgi:tetratricopeptide (TPR) repeat protein
MMKEMQKELGEMDPETAEMMKQRGIEMPDMKKMQDNLGNMSESDITKAWEDDGRVIPEKDEARIIKAGSVKLTEATLSAYIKNVHGAVAIRAGSAASTAADQLLAAARAEGVSGSQIANGLWTFGASNSAILVLGKTLSEKAASPDDLNNYAAFLVMAGAEEAALPVLIYLNSRYRRNSTVLNNIAQAWFGLGDLEKASVWLDSTLAVYPGHSQANLTKSVIQENKGDKNGAAESARRSLKTAYS